MCVCVHERVRVRLNKEEKNQGSTSTCNSKVSGPWVFDSGTAAWSRSAERQAASGHRAVSALWRFSANMHQACRNGPCLDRRTYNLPNDRPQSLHNGYEVSFRTTANGWGQCVWDTKTGRFSVERHSCVDFFSHSRLCSTTWTVHSIEMKTESKRCSSWCHRKWSSAISWSPNLAEANSLTALFCIRTCVTCFVIGLWSRPQSSHIVFRDWRIIIDLPLSQEEIHGP